jgi:hypothetical protein
LRDITRKNLKGINAKVKNTLAPVSFIVPLQGTLALAVYSEAMESGNKPETIIAEAVRAYMGDFS